MKILRLSLWIRINRRSGASFVIRITLYFRYILEDLRSPTFKEHANEDPKDSIIAKITQSEFLILLNLLMSDTLIPQLIPLLEKGGIAELIKHYIKSKCV